MLVLSKIYVLSGTGETVDVPFIGRSIRGSRFLGYRVVLVDTETKEQIVLKSPRPQEIVAKLQELKPYGFIYNHDKPLDESLYLIAVSQQALEFLDYVESVDLIKKYKCPACVSRVSTYDAVTVEEFLDDVGSFLCLCITPKNVNDPIREGYCTLLDAVTIYNKSWQEDAFYLPAIADEEMKDDTYVYRVKCSNFALAKRLITRTKMLNPGLFDRLYQYGFA